MTAKGEKGLMDFLLAAQRERGDKVPDKLKKVLVTYGKASEQAIKIKELLISGSLQDYSKIQPVDGLTILILASIMDDEAASKAKALVKASFKNQSNGGKKRAENDKAHQAMVKIETIHWPNYEKRHLIIQGIRGHIKLFVDLMENEYPVIKRRKSIEELVARLKKQAQATLPGN